MRLTIKDKNGHVDAKAWVAKTKRGFNKKQLKEQEEFRRHIAAVNHYYEIGTKEYHLKNGGTEAGWSNYQGALLEWMTRQ